MNNNAKTNNNVEEEETYQLTPKGVACLALLQSGLIQTIEDPRFDGFWRIFEEELIDMGYLEIKKEEELL